MKTRLERLLAGIVLFLSSACVPTSQPYRAATAAAINRAVQSTATAQTRSDRQPFEAVETAQAEATHTSQNAQATQAAQNEQSARQQAATQAVREPIRAELPTYGIDPSQGRLGWVQDKVSLEVDGYKQYAYSNQSLDTVAADLVISADITWNTQYGTSGCGFVLRSNGRKAALDQYLVIATRGASGHILFATMANNQVVGGRDLYVYGKDKNFRSENDATNRLTVVGRGQTFTIYMNGVEIGAVDPTAPTPAPSLPPPPPLPANLNDPGVRQQYPDQLKQYEQVKSEIQGQYLAKRNEAQQANKTFARGFVAMTVLSESGRTSCQFKHAWLWLLD